MKTTILSIMAACFCVISFCAKPAEATLVTIAIEAVVDDVHDSDNYLEGKVHVGDLITGAYTYDTDTPDSSSLSGVGRYKHYAYPFGFSLSVGGLEFMTDPTNTSFLIEIVNNYPYDDGYGVVSYNNPPLSNGTSVNNISWGLKDYSATALSSIELSATAPILGDWQDNFLNIGGGTRAKPFGILGHVTSAIPEPATVLLFGLGGLLVGRRR